jgi:hypothetical protein
MKLIVGGFFELNFRFVVELFSQRFPMDCDPRNTNPKVRQKSEPPFPPFQPPPIFGPPWWRKISNFLIYRRREMKLTPNESLFNVEKNYTDHKVVTFSTFSLESILCISQNFLMKSGDLAFR